MGYKALIVEDQREYQEEMAEVVQSLGHSCDVAGTLEEARRLLDGGRYAYHLIDLEIPVKSSRGNPHIENGMNLLSEIYDHGGFFGPPTIVVTGHGKNTCELSTRAMRLGAVNYVTKPLREAGKTLDCAIREALTVRRQRLKDSRRLAGSSKSQKNEGISFGGGDLELRDEGVWLCGVKVLSDRGYQTTLLLEALARRNDLGEYIRYSGEQLVQITEAYSGMGSITGTIAHMRRQFREKLQEHARTICGTNDVIVHNDQGYYLRDWIHVVDRRSAAMLAAESIEDHESAPDAPLLNSRQVWVIEQLEKGIQLKRVDIETQFRVCDKTAKNDLKHLRDKGLIEFTSKPWPGHYRLKRVRVVA